jgi:multidrug efflux pump subunit AcrA (membrane-fusion protein)
MTRYRFFRWLLGAGLIVALVLGAGYWVIWEKRAGESLVTGTARGQEAQATQEPERAISVCTVNPKLDPAFEMPVEEPGYVEAYYRAELEARQAGPVKYIKKDIGDAVTKGEVLAVVDVPDLVQEVAQKEAAVERAKNDLKLAAKQIAVAAAAVEVADNNIHQKEAEADQAKATMDFRALELKRAQVMVKRQALYEDVVDERERDHQAAKAAYQGAQVAIEKARADWKEARAKLDAVRADVDLKQSLIEVARKDRDRTQALADYAKVVAPFDGVIVHRSVGPGSFVQNATTGHSESLLTVERTDVVTVVTRIPDTYAPYVAKGTEALMEMTELPGQIVHGKVTRRSPSLHEKDRRMRVEMDLFNGTEGEYEQFLAKERASGFADLKGEDIPIFPRVTARSASAEPHPLLPGMFGKVRLILRKFKNAYLLPSEAIFSEGGKPYIYEVKAGKAHLVPVDVQVDNGKTAKVAMIVKMGELETKRELTGAEEIVLTNQGELTDGQDVRPVPMKR